MKIVWLCNYSLYYLKDKLDVKIEASSFHPATWLYFLQQEIQNWQDIQLHIITIAPYIRKDYVVQDGNVTYYLFATNKYRIQDFIGHLLPNYFIYKNIVKEINKIAPDIVTAHGTETHHGLLLNRLNYKFPSIVWMQGVINHVAQYENNSSFRRKLKNENKVLKKQKYYITVPSNMENIILENNADAKFYHLYYPISPFAFKLKSENIQKDSDIIFSGALIKRKGIEDLIDAISILVQTHPRAKVKIIGRSDPDYLNYLKNKISEYKIDKNIKIVGFIPDHNDVLLEIKKAKIFILPTYVDSGPRAVAESMAIGTPVISYDVDGLPVMIKNGVSGILVEKGNVHKLADAARVLIDDEKKMDNLASEADLYARENFSVQLIVPKLIDIYNKVISDTQANIKFS